MLILPPKRNELLKDPDGVPAPHRDQRYVSLALLGQYLNCDRKTVWRLLCTGALPQSAVMRCGSEADPHYRICPALVYAWLKDKGPR